MRGFLRSIAATGLAVAGAMQAGAADWPQFLGPHRDGISTETAWRSDWSAREPAIAWRTTVGVGSASVAIVGGKLYTTGNLDNADVVFCLDAETGRQIWRHAVPMKLDKRMFEGGTAATPTVDGDRVYTLSHKGHLLCLQKDSGKVMWSTHLVDALGGKEPQWGFAGSPLILGNLLITEPGGKGASVVALDKMTGKLVWRQGSDEAAYASPIVYRSGGAQRVAVMNAYGLVGLEPATGREEFRVRWKTSYDVNATTPLYVPGTDQFFITSDYRKGCGLVALEGETRARLLYESRDLQLKFQNALRIGNRVFGVIEELKCIDLASGKQSWGHRVSGKEGNVIAAGGKLIVLSEKGELIVGNPGPRGFEELGRVQVLSGRCWVLPAISDGRIYCRNNAGTLVCIDVRG